MLRILDSKPMMWEKINNQFYGSDGPGEFGYEKMNGTIVNPIVQQFSNF